MARKQSERLTADGASIDLIMSDINMPETDGVEFLMHVSSTGTKTALVYISGAISPVIAGVEVLGKAIARQLSRAHQEAYAR